MYLTLVDTPVKLLPSRNCADFQLNNAQCLKQPHLFTGFYKLVFPSILLCISLLMVVFTVPGTVRELVISLLYQNFTLCTQKSVKTV